MAYFSKRQKAQMRARRKRKAAADAAVAASTSSDSNFRTIIGGNDHAGADADADANGDTAPDVGDSRDASEGRGGGGEDEDPANGTSQRRTTVTRAVAPKTAPDDRVDVDDNAEAPEVVGAKRNKLGTGSGAGDGVVRIKVPSGLDGRELKKFRKDRRRKMRKQNPGIRDEHIVFVASSDWKDEEEDHLPHGSDDGPASAGEMVGGDSTAVPTRHPPPSPDRKRRRTREFPRINEILAAQKAAERAEREKAERQKLYNMVPPEERARYVAVDCEMVGVGAGGKRSALARASLVDWDGNVVLDTFVTVPERVTDFRTFVSGVRAKDIRRPTTTGRQKDVDGGTGTPGTMELNECRDIVGKALKDKVLVGHALKNDLQALLLDHPRKDIRDTARYKPYMRVSGRGGGKYRARKLRDLAKERLGMTIQVRGESHSSVDDAVAAMELYKLERVRWEKELALKHQRKK